jgi:hypothetical protein
MKTTYIDGKPETKWAMEQVSRIFGFATIEEVKASLKYNEYGVAELKKNGLRLIGTRNKNAWASLKIAWGKCGMQNEAALEYTQRYIQERAR